jgi:hypothetical protein
MAHQFTSSIVHPIGVVQLVVEEVELEGCSGFLWKLLFEVTNISGSVNSFYAQYWPAGNASSVLEIVVCLR